MQAARRATNVSVESVGQFLAEKAPDIDVIALSESSSTMTLSAAWDIKPAQIAKTLAMKVGDAHVLLVSCGDSRLDNQKIKAALGGKAKMLSAEETVAVTGHPVGGVCPFGLPAPLPVYCDVMLKSYEFVVPAAGSTHAALRIDPVRLAELVEAEWVDVCK
ncbi:YbaK/EbsC family protein [Burkholderia mallei]|nr:YbaK/EbsC family protein [Burkholderia mallei]